MRRFLQAFCQTRSVTMSALDGWPVSGYASCTVREGGGYMESLIALIQLATAVLALITAILMILPALGTTICDIKEKRRKQRAYGVS